MATEDSRDQRDIAQYDHPDKKRANNPPVGLVTPATDPDAARKTYQYDPHLDPQLVWAGKAEHTSFDVPTVSLHVHERIDPRTIIRAVQKQEPQRDRWQQMSLFETQAEYLPLRQAVEFYKHPHGWSNRLIAGDSLVVMNSLLQKEGMAGKVQMIYIDPPYGIRYGSNFQPFVNRRDVKDGSDADLTQEPEMVKAFRDTWELGVHSYLSNLRDRLILGRDLLHESGSCLVQISDTNLHHVRELMDEIFGAHNFCSIISFLKTTGASSPMAKTNVLASVADYLVWYARDIGNIKYRQPYVERKADDDYNLRWVQFDDGNRVRLSSLEDVKAAVERGGRLFRPNPLTSQTPGETTTYPYEFQGKVFSPGTRGWSTHLDGMKQLEIAERLMAIGNTLCFIRFLSDFPVKPISNNWYDTRQSGFAEPKRYVVQTATRTIERCLLMTTDPGDLVFDPTCGSGTTAYVAEQWGRRWITCDTSRVAITLAKQRLMTADFDYYTLARPDKGVGSGFVCKTVPHVTLKSIANNPEIREGVTRTEIDAAIMKYADRETLYDQPEIDRSKARVSGPFTVEAVPAPAVRPITEIVVEARPVELNEQPTLPGIGPVNGQAKLEFTEDVSIARYGETYRQRQWRDELRAAGIRGRAGQRIEFARLEPMGGTRWLQCQGETKPTGKNPLPGPLPKGEGASGEGVIHRVVVSFGPEHAPLEQRQVSMALDEAQRLRPAPTMVVFAAFQFDPEAAKDIDETNWPGVTLLKVQMNTDLLTEDLKKARSSNESYWLMGQPDVELRPIKKGEAKGRYEVEVRGFDYYNTRTGQVESGDTTKIAMWMLDTDYDGRSLYPRQVFFPMAGPKDGWARLAKSLKAEIDEERMEAYRGTVSLPFEPGAYRRAAVKIVDDRGIESLKIVEIG